MQACSWSKQSSTVTEIPDKSMSLQSDLQVLQFLQKEGQVALIHDIFSTGWSSVSDVSLNSFLCTLFVEVLTFAILWIGLLIEPEPVEICRIKS